MAPISVSTCRRPGCPRAREIRSLVGCDKAEESTQIVVVVDSDLSVGTELTSVRVRVLDSEDNAEQSSQDFPLVAKAEKGKHTLPFRVRLARSSNEPGMFRLAVTGRGPLGPEGSEVDVAEQQALVVFRPHVSSRLDMFLARICLQKLCRDGAEQQTCDVTSGECGQLPVKGETGEPVQPGAAMDADVPVETTDAGLDGKVVIDRLPDASMEVDAQVEPDASSDAASLDADTVDAETLDATVIDAQPQGCPAGQIMTTSGCVPNPCDSTPCQHGGVCSAPNGQVQCTCDGTGYSGARCEADINECATAQCPADYPCVQTAPPGYTCRGQFADWPMPDYEIGAKVAPSYDAAADGVVVDNVTGLWWQSRSLSSAGTPYSTYPPCNSPTRGCTWELALAYCDQLVLGNVTDWRLPTRIELLSTLDTRTIGPQTEPFWYNSLSEVFWTASHVGGSMSTAWANIYTTSVMWTKDMRTDVRCVRGGRPLRSPRYTINATANEVADERTGLVWQRSMSVPVATREAALARCASQGGAWRLPTGKELTTLIDHAHALDATPAVDVSAFPNMVGARYWSTSTTTVNNTTTAMITNMMTGQLEYAPNQPGEHHVLCVR